MEFEKKSSIGKRIRAQSLLENKLNQLPISRKLLDQVTENIEDFQVRRITWVISRMLQNGEPLDDWRVVRKAGLKRGYSRRVHDVITIQIEGVKKNLG